jgi:hypothetical protein
MTARKSKQTARVYFYVSCSCVFTDRGWDIQTYTGGWFSHVLPPNRWSISLKLVCMWHVWTPHGGSSHSYASSTPITCSRGAEVENDSIAITSFNEVTLTADTAPHG